MKRNSLKTIFSAVVFTMAIVASFAFSPALNDTEDVAVDGYIQTLDPDDCQPITHDCSNTGNTPCTINIFPVGVTPVYGTDNGTTCANQLVREP